MDESRIERWLREVIAGQNIWPIPLKEFPPKRSWIVSKLAALVGSRGEAAHFGFFKDEA
jgi:hypothetical protein